MDKDKRTAAELAAAGGDAMARTIEELQRRQKEAEPSHRIAALEEQVEDLASMVATHGAGRAVLVEEIEKLKKVRGDLQQQVNDLEEELNLSRMRVQDLEAECNVAGQSITRAVGEIHQLQKQRDTTQAQLETFISGAADLTIDAMQLQADLTATQTENKELELAVESLEKDLAIARIPTQMDDISILRRAADLIGGVPVQWSGPLAESVADLIPWFETGDPSKVYGYEASEESTDESS